MLSLIILFLKYFHVNNETVGCNGSIQADVNQAWYSCCELGAVFKSVCIMFIAYIKVTYIILYALNTKEDILTYNRLLKKKY